MLNQPQNSINLSDEQKESIEYVNSRLANTEAEVAIATKNLKMIKAEIERVVKEKLDLEESVFNLGVQENLAKVKLEKISEDVKNGEDRLTKISEEDRKTKTEQSTKESELNERENKIKEAEEKLSERQEELRKEIILFEEAREKLAEFKEELSKVISKW